MMFTQAHLPFAVVGSTDEIKVGNKMMKARQYPWGTVQGNVITVLYQVSSGVVEMVLQRKLHSHASEVEQTTPHLTLGLQ